MKKYNLFFFLFIGIISITKAQTATDNFATYKLDNGLTVVLDRDPTQTLVFGVVGVNAGSKNEDLNATGVAHYLEHMLFKGTETLGTSDWEKEKPLIDKIVKLYDKLQTAKSDEEIKKINKEINDVSQKASEFVIPNEFSKLVQQMGGVELNASTSYDVTEYHNAFPPSQLEKWLDLYAHRFQKPVFRLFQTELEAVYEEKNRSEDNPTRAYFDAAFKEIFGDHPYGRSIIGFTEHLKKPWMRKMREFYDKWYVPENMVLVLSGNFDIASAKKLIAQKFGVWEAKKVAKKSYPSIKPFKGRVKKKVKVTNFLRAELAYRGVSDKNEKDILTLDVIAQMLSNSSKTGLLDKVYLDGNAMFIHAGHLKLDENTTFRILYAPPFDANQRRQLSFKDVEEKIDLSLNSLKNGTYKYWLLDQVKDNMIKDYLLALESPYYRAMMFVKYYTAGKDVASFFDYEKAVKSITKEDVSKAVKKYLGNDLLAFYSYKGETDKEKIKKPKIDPIKPKKHSPSIYAQKFDKLPTTEAIRHFVDLEKDVKAIPFQDKINLLYVKNNDNDVFTMNVLFDVGNIGIPNLEYAIALMNNSGVMAKYKPDELRKEMGKLGVTYKFFSNNDKTMLTLQGEEKNLGKACQLISKLMLLPKIEDKALDRIMGNEYYSRMMEKKMASAQSPALFSYIRYGEKSPYIDRSSIKKLLSLSPTDLAGVFNKAISYSANIHYYGKLSLGQVKYILKKNLAFSANRKQGNPAEQIPNKKYQENTIFLVNNKKARQSKIYFYVKGNNIPKQDYPLIEGFNQYFSGGFNGLMMKEIREYRSLAYTAGGSIAAPKLSTWDAYLYAIIGSQADKTLESVRVTAGLLNKMPKYEDRMKGIKDFLINHSYLDEPKKRSLSYAVYDWKIRGYKEDPTKFNLPYYEKITFSDIMEFYKKEFQNKPYAIGIVGNLSKINQNELKKFGKIKKIDAKKIFSKE